MTPYPPGYNWVGSLVRESVFGQIVSILTARKTLKSEYERESYHVPKKYLDMGSPEPIIVDWDGPDDIHNPLRWPARKKNLIAVIICLSTSAVYMAAGLFSPIFDRIMDDLDNHSTAMNLVYSLFVWGYGIAPVWFSPMSESPVFRGRNYIYIISQVIFVCLQVPTALAKSSGELYALRLLAGIAAAPFLNTTGATLMDMYGFPKIVYALNTWNCAIIAGPYLGPVIGAAVGRSSWRWAFWYILIQAGVVLGVLFVFLPETSQHGVLMAKARALRRRTGNTKIMAEAEIVASKLTWRDILRDDVLMAFYVPLKLTLREPILLMINIHCGLIYAIIYIFFNSFHTVFGVLHNFTPVTLGVAFSSCAVGSFTSFFLLLPYLRSHLVNPMLRGEIVSPEHVFLGINAFASFTFPISLLVFGWGAHRSVHWIVPMIGTFLFEFGTFAIFECYFSYMGYLYPNLVASAFASNTICRCLIAGSAPLWANAMYSNLGPDNFPVGWGCTILGILGFVMFGFSVFLYKYGLRIRMYTLKKYHATEAQGPH